MSARRSDDPPDDDRIARRVVEIKINSIVTLTLLTAP
jgi:hypothetical protein